MHTIDRVQGRMLSRELITSYAEQAQEGIDRVERSVREIETTLRSGQLDDFSARVLLFIPSGGIWDILADDRTRQAWFDSHAVVPTRIVYPDDDLRLDGARISIYDNNHPGNDDLVIELFEKNGELHFKYDSFSPDNKFTLGTGTLKGQLIDDVDLPFAAGDAEQAVLLYALDFVNGPVNLRIESRDGDTLGLSEGTVQGRSRLGYTCPWHPNYLLTVPGMETLERHVIGSADGAYSLCSVHPGGRSLTLLDIPCRKGSRDVVSIDPGMGTIVIHADGGKTIDLRLEQRMADRSLRQVRATLPMRDGQELHIATGEGLEGVRFVPRGAETRPPCHCGMFGAP